MADNKVTYRYDGMERQYYEKREDWNASARPPAWEDRYLVEQEYDKNGNRTRLHRTTESGYETDYGNSEDLSYTFNNVNALTAISDSDDSDFSCTIR